jgi:hypothetical protein
MLAARPDSVAAATATTPIESMGAGSVKSERAALARAHASAAAARAAGWLVIVRLPMLVFTLLVTDVGGGGEEGGGRGGGARRMLRQVCGYTLREALPNSSSS